MTPAVVLVSGSPFGGSSLPLAAALAVEAAQTSSGPALLAELAAEPRRRAPTLFAAPAARGLEATLREAGLRAAARGHLCHLAAPASAEGLAELAGAASASTVCVARVPGGLWTLALDYGELEIRGGLVLVELPRERPLAALAAAELRDRGLRARVASRPLPALATRRALAGIRPGGSAGARLARLAQGLLLPRGEGESGQALPAVLGAAAVIAICALLLTAIGGAVTGKGRVQRAADLAALSAARQMRDALPRLLAPPRLPDGSPNPRHLSRGQYLGRARLAALDAARRNRVDPRRLRVSFPDADGWPPLRARVRVLAELDPRRLPGGERLGARAGPPVAVGAFAVAEASLPVASWSGMPTMASGGGYSGPLVYRNGEPSR